MVSWHPLKHCCFWSALYSGFTRRKLIRRSLYGALAVFPIPALVIFGDLGPQVGDTLKHTIWKKGVRLVRDSHEGGTPIKASEVTIGSVFHVIPENLKDIEDHGEKLNQKAKAAVQKVHQVKVRSTTSLE